MKRCSLLILAFLLFVSSFGGDKSPSLQKSRTSFIISDNAPENLTSCSRPFEGEIEFASNQITNVTQASTRSHGLAGCLGHPAVGTNHVTGFISRIERRFDHFSHKAYLLHIYPSHNFW